LIGKCVGHDDDDVEIEYKYGCFVVSAWKGVGITATSLPPASFEKQQLQLLFVNGIVSAPFCFCFWEQNSISCEW
jgi:hypothetical protein